MSGNIPSRNQRASFAHIRKGIRASFAIAALFAFVLVLCIAYLIHERENDAKIINLAGSQRTLSQKLAKDFYVAGFDKPPIPEIKNDAELWDSIHNVLRYGNSELGIPKPKNSEIVRLFGEISPYQQKLYRSVMDRDTLRPDGTAYDDVRQWEKRFVVGMDRIVMGLQVDAEKGLSDLKYIVAFLMSLFILFIFGLYRILVKPIIKMVKSLSNEREERAEQERSILENTSDLIWSLDLEYRIVTFNSAFSKALEEKTGTIPKIGEHIPSTAFSEEKIKKWEELLGRAFAGESFRSELKSEKEDKTTHHELSFNPIFDLGGGVAGCNIFSRDVTVRAETYKRLARSEKYLREAQEIANLGNWNWDMAGNGVYWSDQVYKVFGQDPKTFRPSYEGLLGLLHPDDREAFKDHVSTCIENGTPHDIVHRIVLGGREHPLRT